MSTEKLINKIIKLPKNPGVYIFYGEKRKILYVGKATNLRSRAWSYFADQKRFDLSRPQRPKEVEPRYARPIEFVVDQIADIEVKETNSVLEALILESHLIKKYLPKYNAMGKDDKSFCYFVITKEEWPRVLILRKTDLEAIDVIASEAKQSRLKKQGSGLPRRYAPRNDNINVKKIYGPYASKKQMEIALKILRKIFPFHSSNQKTEKDCLDFQIGRCPGPYADAISKTDYLKNILGIRMILEGKKKSLVKKLEKEMHIFAKNNEFEKAAEARNKIFALKHIQDVTLISEEHPLPQSLSPNGARENMEKNIRVEAYDISNISGQYAVGSMVVFRNNEPDKSQYRKFRIKTITSSDDVGMMKEILVRRFKNNWPASTRGDALSTRGWPMPDLILLDGGAGHLNMAEKLISNLGLSVSVAAVAKGATRKNLQPTTYNLQPKLKKLLENKNLLKQIMDEAHRFAITYHRKIRRKNLLD